MQYKVIMNTISEEYLHLVINKVANEIQLEDCSFNKESFQNIGQNYFGLLIPIKLNGKIRENSVNISTVLKLAPTDKRYLVSGAMTLMFAREIFVYTKIFKKYRQILNNINFTSQFIIPECYYVCKDYCNEVIAMENMCEKKYEPFTGSLFLNKEHVIVALRALAQFHAMSYILKSKDGAFYKKAETICVPLNETTNKRFMEILINRLEKALVKFENTEYVPLLKTLKNRCTEIIEAASLLVKSVCLCHGDIWKENVLFKYEDNIPISACIIDYQTTRISSPAFDVLYFIICSTSTDLRKEIMTQLLDTYYYTFEQTLAQAGLNSNEIYTKHMFDQDLRIVGPTCFIIANTATWLASGLQQEGHVRSKIILTTETEKLEGERTYKNIIKGILDDLTAYGFLNVVNE